MFLLNSCLCLFSADSCEAPLSPKLRGHFAEFLNNTSPVGLWIFSSSTCVGLRYGYNQRYSGFSRQCGFSNFPTLFQSSSHFVIWQRICLLPKTLCLTGFSLSPVCLSSCVPTVLIDYSTGISTSCPSTTTLVLALGPDLPWEDQLYSGNLRYSAYKILTYISLLIPAFSLLFSPPSFSLRLRPYRLLLYHWWLLSINP